MKKILLSAVLIFAGAALWAQSFTGNAALDAKIKAESQKLTDGGYVVIDEATETVLQLYDEAFELETNSWPKNKLTDYLIQPKFGEELGTSTYATTALELTWFYAIMKCELADYEKYVEELKAFGWNIDVDYTKGDDLLSFDARHKAGLKMHFTYRKSNRDFNLVIDSRDEE